MADWGRIAYGLYRAATYLSSPFIYAHIRCRILRGLDHPTRWPERLGRPSAPHPHGPLLWFHAVSLGEGMAAIPVIKHCMSHSPHFTLLLTSTTTSAFSAIKDLLPSGVIYQFAPIDTPMAVDGFLGHWKPTAIFLMESELWPNLIISASERRRWSQPVALPLIALMLSKLSLIVPLSTTQAIRFQLLQAPPSIINFAGDLKYAVGNIDSFEKEGKKIEDLKQQLANRPVWMAASIHKGEEEDMLWVHQKLMKIYPDLVTVLVPRHPKHGQQILETLKRNGMTPAVRSKTDVVSPSTSLYLVDTLGELRTLYRITPIAVIGGSFLPTLAGHNISEAAAAGCSVLTGPHVGHFSHMISEMKQSDSLSVTQVAGKVELLEALHQLLSKPDELEVRRNAAKKAFIAISNGIVQSVWNLVNIHVLCKQGSFRKTMPAQQC